MYLRSAKFWAVLVLFCMLPFAAHAGSTPHWVHYRWLNSKVKLPKKALIIPFSVKVFEVTAGGVTEEVPEWSKEAGANILKSVSHAVENTAKMKEISMPGLSSNQAAVLDEHMALYKLVVNTANAIDPIGFKHKLEHFDYSIGPGLEKIFGNTGAEVIVLVYGTDYASTTGRKVKAVLGNIPIVNIFTGPPPQLGHSFVHIGVIDIKTGDILWMNSQYREGASNLRDYDDAAKIVHRIFKWYPGIEQYRAVYVK